MRKTLEQLNEDLENARGGCNTGDIEAAVSAIEDYYTRVMAQGILEIEELMNESKGIYGLHLNGDVSPWEELRSGGKYEEWLNKFEVALEYAKKSFKYEP